MVCLLTVIYTIPDGEVSAGTIEQHQIVMAYPSSGHILVGVKRDIACIKERFV